MSSNENKTADESKGDEKEQESRDVVGSFRTSAGAGSGNRCRCSSSSNVAAHFLVGAAAARLGRSRRDMVLPQHRPTRQKDDTHAGPFLPKLRVEVDMLQSARHR